MKEEFQPQKTQKGSEFLFEKESYDVRGVCFEVYKEMGSGFLEAVYLECLEMEFFRRSIPFCVFLRFLRQFYVLVVSYASKER